MKCIFEDASNNNTETAFEIINHGDEDQNNFLVPNQITTDENISEKKNFSENSAENVCDETIGNGLVESSSHKSPDTIELPSGIDVNSSDMIYDCSRRQINNETINDYYLNCDEYIEDNQTTSTETANQHTETSTLNEKGYKVFVGGVGQETQEHTLEQHFSQYGNIIRCVVVTYKKSHRNRGFGFITYDTEESAQKAIGAKHMIDNVIVECRKALSKNEIKSTVPIDSRLNPCKVFVGGIPDNANEESVKAFFLKFGDIVDVSLIYNKINHKSRGFGFVLYSSLEGAMSAVGLHNFHGKTIEAKPAVPRDALSRDAAANNRTQSQEYFDTHGVDNYSSYGFNQQDDFVVLGAQQYSDIESNYQNRNSWGMSSSLTTVPKHFQRFSPKMQHKTATSENKTLKNARELNNEHPNSSSEMDRRRNNIPPHIMKKSNNFQYNKSALKTQLNLTDSNLQEFGAWNTKTYLHRPTIIPNYSNHTNNNHDNNGVTKNHISLQGNNNTSSFPFFVVQPATTDTSNTASSAKNPSQVYLQHSMNNRQYYVKNHDETTQSPSYLNIVNCSTSNNYQQPQSQHNEHPIPSQNLYNNNNLANVVFELPKLAETTPTSFQMTKSTDFSNNGNSLTSAPASSIFSFNSPTIQSNNVLSNSVCGKNVIANHDNPAITSTVAGTFNNNTRSKPNQSSSNISGQRCKSIQSDNLTMLTSVPPNARAVTSSQFGETKNLSHNYMVSQNQNSLPNDKSQNFLPFQPRTMPLHQQDLNNLGHLSSLNGFSATGQTARQGKYVHPSYSSSYTLGRSYEEQQKQQFQRSSNPSTLFTEKSIQRNQQEPIQVLLQPVCPPGTLHSVCSPTHPALTKNTNSVVILNNSGNSNNDLASMVPGKKNSLANIIQPVNSQQVSSSATQSPISNLPSFVQTMVTQTSCKQMPSPWYYSQASAAATATPLYKPSGTNTAAPLSVTGATGNGVNGSSATLPTSHYSPLGFGGLTTATRGSSGKPPPLNHHSQSNNPNIIQTPLTSSSFIVGDTPSGSVVPVMGIPANVATPCNHQNMLPYSTTTSKNNFSLGRSLLSSPSPENNDIIITKDETAANNQNKNDLCNDYNNNVSKTTENKNNTIPDKSTTQDAISSSKNAVGNEMNNNQSTAGATLVCSGGQVTKNKSDISSCSIDEAEGNVFNNNSIVASQQHYPVMPHDNCGGLLSSPSQIMMTTATGALHQEELNGSLGAFLSGGIMQHTQKLGANSSLFYPNSVVEGSPMFTLYQLSPSLQISPRGDNMFGRNDTPLIASSSATSSSACDPLGAAAPGSFPAPAAATGGLFMSSPYFFRNQSVSAVKQQQNEDYSRLTPSGLPASPPFPSLVMSPQLHNGFLAGTPTTLQNISRWNYASMHQQTGPLPNGAEPSTTAAPTGTISAAFAAPEHQWMSSQFNDENPFSRMSPRMEFLTASPYQVLPTTTSYFSSGFNSHDNS